MRRLAGLFVVLALLAACQGGPGPAGGGGAGGATSGAGGETTPGSTDGGGTGAGSGAGRPSGAKVRIVNAYNPGSGDGASIDVYAAPWVLSGAKPLINVPYGTTSDFFDPTVADENGDMFLSFYRKGETGNGSELMSKTETLKGGETITYVLTTSADKADDGSPRLTLQALFHDLGVDPFNATPAPGTGILFVDMLGIDTALKAPDGSQWFLSVGQGCTKAVGDDQYTQTAAGPGSGARYALPAGDYTASIHQTPPNAGPDCTTSPLVSNVKVPVAAGQETLLLVFATSPTDVRSIVLPLAP